MELDQHGLKTGVWLFEPLGSFNFNTYTPLCSQYSAIILFKFISNVHWL